MIFFTKKNNTNEAIEITIEQLCCGIRAKGYKRCPIKPLFLFPSEVLRDIKIFLLKISNDFSSPQKKILENGILKFELTNILLQSNCPEYNLLQDLRESEILDDRQTIELILKSISTSFSNLIIKGLSIMSLEDKTLPSWWKLV